MKKHEGGQIIIAVAFALIASLLVLAVIIDGTRLMAERQVVNRVADAAGKGGLIIVGDQMVTQVIGAQKAVNGSTPGSILNGTPSEPTLVLTPGPEDFLSWINDDHRRTLVAPPMQTLVAAHVLGVAEENGLGLGNPSVTNIEIIYPVSYSSGDKEIRIKVRIEHRVPVLFGKFLNLENGVIYGEAEEKIRQR